MAFDTRAACCSWLITADAEQEVLTYYLTCDARADVHLHLADVAMEQACFDIAADDYAKALACLAQCDQARSCCCAHP